MHTILVYYAYDFKMLTPMQNQSRANIDTHKNIPVGLPFRLNDYLELVDWSGRIIREDTKGVIATICRPSCNAWTWMPNSLSTSVRISNSHSKTWSAQRIMYVRPVRQWDRTGFMASTSVRNSFQVVSYSRYSV